MGAPQSIHLRHVLNARRSQRVAARIRVSIRKGTEADGFMTEDSHTVVLNVQGALVALAMKVRPGERLFIKNLLSREEQESRVVHVAEEQGSKNLVAFEFIQPTPRFWHVDFPPADWKLLEEN